MNSIIASFIQVFNYVEIVKTINRESGKTGWRHADIDQYVTRIWNHTKNKESIIFETAYKKAIKRIIKGSCKQSLKKQIDLLRKLSELVGRSISSKQIKKQLYVSLHAPLEKAGKIVTYKQGKEALKKSSYDQRNRKLEEMRRKLLEKVPQVVILPNFLATKLSEELEIDKQAILTELLELDKKDILMLCDLYKHLIGYKDNEIQLKWIAQQLGRTNKSLHMSNGKEAILNIQALVKRVVSLDKCNQFMQFLTAGKKLFEIPYLIQAFCASIGPSSI